jgi:hypothetical protein
MRLIRASNERKGTKLMQDLYRVITRDQAIERFHAEELPYCIDAFEQDGEPDWPARSEAWNNWTDMLCKAGEISDWQYENWTHPDCCLTPAEKRQRDRCRELIAER